MEDIPTLEKVNDGLYRCSLCKDGFRIERNYAGRQRTEQEWQHQREKDFRGHLLTLPFVSLIAVVCHALYALNSGM